MSVLVAHCFSSPIMKMNFHDFDNFLKRSEVSNCIKQPKNFDALEVCIEGETMHKRNAFMSTLRKMAKKLEGEFESRKLSKRHESPDVKGMDDVDLDDIDSMLKNPGLNKRLVGPSMKDFMKQLKTKNNAHHRC